MSAAAENTIAAGLFYPEVELDGAVLRDALDRAGYTASGIKALKRDLRLSKNPPAEPEALWV